MPSHTTFTKVSGVKNGWRGCRELNLPKLEQGQLARVGMLHSIKFRPVAHVLPPVRVPALFLLRVGLSRPHHSPPYFLAGEPCGLPSLATTTWRYSRQMAWYMSITRLSYTWRLEALKLSESACSGLVQKPQMTRMTDALVAYCLWEGLSRLQ